MKRTIAALAASLSAVILAVPAVHAYPNGPVQIVVPAAPGGAVDAIARIIGRQFERKLGQPFPIINTPGGATAIGARKAASAKPDGQTIFISHQQLFTAAATGLLGFDPVEQFVPLGQTGRMENFVVAHASAPYRDLEGLAKHAKANPKKVNVAIEIGGLDHIVMLQLGKEMGVEFNFVNVPGGGAPKVQSVMGKFTDITTLGPGPLGPVYRSGDLRPLVTLLKAAPQSAEYPEVPSTGAKGYSTEWFLTFWWLVPKGTPENVRKQLSATLAEIMSDPEVKKEIEGRGGITEAAYWAPETAAANMKRLLVDYTQVVKSFGITR